MFIKILFILIILAGIGSWAIKHSLKYWEEYDERFNSPDQTPE